MDREQWNERYRSKELVWSAGPNRFLVEEVAELTRAGARSRKREAPAREVQLTRAGARSRKREAPAREVQLTPGRALDLACGEGRNALWLAEQGWKVSASDFSEVAIDKARNRARELGLDIELTVADARDPVAGEFELVIVFYLQLPADQMEAVLANASRALATGGTLLVVGHDARNIDEGFGGPQDPAVLYSPDEVAGWLPDLEILRAETVERPVTRNGDTQVALDVLVRARKRAPAAGDGSR